MIQVNVGDTEANTQVIFEPQPCTNAKLDHGLVWASSINKVADDSTIILSVLNLTDNDVTIEKNTEIGELEEAEILEEKEDSLTLNNGEINWHKIKIGHDLSTKQKELIQELVVRHKDVFQWSEFDTGATNLTEHSIETGEISQ